MEQGKGYHSGMWIVAAAIMYLLLPNILFLLGWVTWYIAWPSVLVLLVSFGKLCRKIPCKAIRLQRSDAWVVALLVLGAAGCTASLGLHGHVPQQWDFTVRNPIYETLVRCDWPLLNAEGGYFVYYMAYWLPPALISKMSMEWISPTTVLWWWNFSGVLLLLLLLWLRWRKRVLLIMLLMFTLGSLNDLRRIYGFAKWVWEQSPALEWIEPYASIFADWTNYFFLGLWNQIACNTPHSAIPICMMIALVFSKRLPWQYIPFTAALTVLWSPLAALVMLPWLVVQMLGKLRSRSAWKDAFNPYSLGSGLLLLYLVGNYFVCSDTGMVHFIHTDAPFYNDWMLDTQTRCLKGVAIICMMMVPLLVFLGKHYRKTGIPHLCAVLILFLPIVWVGYENNELLFKGSATVFMLLVVLYASRVVHARGWWRVILIAFFLFSAGEFIWDVGFRIVHKYTWDAQAMKKNIRDDWQGHLNHPQHFCYKNFFGQTPHGHLLYRKSGESAQHALRPFATGKTAADANPERLK